MTEKILCVDDDANILLGFQRALRSRFQIDVAQGGEEGLEALGKQGPYAVVVADMRMPGMTGVELLARARAMAPDTVRMMLTGNSDQRTALEAVNQGHVFRFLTKPCRAEELARALEAGLSQYRLIVAEQELLTKTLSGSVKLLTDVLSLVRPLAFSRAARVRALARKIAQDMRADQLWAVEVAAMLCQIGCIALPDDLLARHAEDKELSHGDLEALAAHPLVAQDLLRNIPRLEGVAEIIGYQNKHFDGGGTPPDDRCGNDLPLGSRILKVVLDFDVLVAAGRAPEIAVAELLHRTGWYDPEVVAALRRVCNFSQAFVLREIPVGQLRDGMVLASDVRSHEGTLLCAKGLEVNKAVRLRLRNCVCNWGLSGRVEVFIPFCGSAADRDAGAESARDGGGASSPESVWRASAVQVMSETSW